MYRLRCREKREGERREIYEREVCPLLPAPLAVSSCQFYIFMKHSICCNMEGRIMCVYRLSLYVYLASARGHKSLSVICTHVTTPMTKWGAMWYTATS